MKLKEYRSKGRNDRKWKGDLTESEVAVILNLTRQRVSAMIKQDLKPRSPRTKTRHFPHARLCICGKGWLIPEEDVKDYQTRKQNEISNQRN